MSLTVQHNFVNKNYISCNSGIDTKTMTDCGAHDLLVKGSHVPYPCASVFNFFQQESFATFVAEIENTILRKGISLEINTETEYRQRYYALIQILLIITKVFLLF